MMIRYIGIDQSLTSSGIVVMDYDTENLEEIGDFTIGFTTHLKKKWSDLSHHIGVERISEKDFTRTEQIVNFFKKYVDVLDKGFDEVYLAVEGYSMGFTQVAKKDGEGFRQAQQTSRILQLGELAGCTKYMALGCGAQVRDYSPARVKMYGTGKGKGDKLPMYMAVKNDASTCPVAGMIVHTLDENKVASPMADVTDAYYIARMVRDHHWITKGWLNPDAALRKVFCRKTKKNPALIDQPFLRSVS